MKEFSVQKNDAGQRVDKFVLKITSSLPQSLLYKAIRLKKIKVNRKRCEPGLLLKEGDTVQCFLAPDFFAEKEASFRSLTPQIEAVYEDENLLIVSKPEGQSCHSDETQKTGTLIDHIKAYLAQKGEYRPEEENSFAPALCNRIDRNTSGLVICAKNAASLREMNEMIRERKVEKRYLAWVRGVGLPEHAVLKHYLLKDEKKNRVTVFDAPHKGALTAITEFFKRKETDSATLIEVLLHTGRTHQIRAQMAHIGHPLLGDAKYAKPEKDGRFPHQALRSDSLCFHPSPDSFLSYLANVAVRAPKDERFS